MTAALTAAFICVVSLSAFLQFFISYCRSILATGSKVALSDRVREITGLSSDAEVIPDDFHRLLQLVQLCPERADDQTEIRAVGTYYSLLRLVGKVSGALLPKIAHWAEQERRSCSYFAAVVLDRRISYSRELLTQQSADTI